MMDENNDTYYLGCYAVNYQEQTIVHLLEGNIVFFFFIFFLIFSSVFWNGKFWPRPEKRKVNFY